MVIAPVERKRKNEESACDADGQKYQSEAKNDYENVVARVTVDYELWRLAYQLGKENIAKLARNQYEKHEWEKLQNEHLFNESLLEIAGVESAAAITELVHHFCELIVDARGLKVLVALL